MVNTMENKLNQDDPIICSLNELARRHVGDCGSPNAFFFSRGGNVVAVVDVHLDMHEIERIRMILNAEIVEDRRTGVVIDVDDRC
jgi:hypothetical protein